ncbi:MAG: HEAT repeat domain-containing protein, partial [Verrucomicrobiae bacterium]|nr:HEAT repeat domain-containing protein [Verrucomicrobiae bacterium]
GADVRPQTQFDGYAPETYVGLAHQVGWVHLTRGRHTLTYVCLGKREASSGYNLGVDDIVLAKVGPKAWAAAAELGEPQVLTNDVAELGRILTSDSDSIRRGLAAIALRDQPGNAKRVLPDLIAALKDPDLCVRMMTAKALAAIGPDAAPAVEALIATASRAGEKVHVLRSVADALGGIGKPAAVPALPVLRELRKIPRVQWSAESAIRKLEAPVDLTRQFKQWGLPRWTQGNRPTCSTFTVAGALEFALAKREGRGTRLSVEFLNWAANDSCGDSQDGGFFSDLWKGFTVHGICPAEAFPYAATFDPTATPSAEAVAQAKERLTAELKFHWIKEWDVNTGLTEAHLAAIKATLGAGWPVCAGLRWPKRQQWVDGVLQMCPPDAVRDGHSVLLIGYREDPAQPGGGVLLFRNTANGGKDGAMPYAYARAYMNDAAWIE